MYIGTRHIKDKVRIYLACALYIMAQWTPFNARRQARGKTRVLVFHHLDKPDLFRRILRTIQTRYHLISFDDYLDGKIAHDRINIIISMDDGYQSWQAVGRSLFADFHLRPLLFINSGFIGQDGHGSHTFCTNHIHTWPEQAATWQGLRDLAAIGSEIGGHSHDHTDLTGPHGSAEKMSSITENRVQIERHLGVPPRLFAYPYGRYDAAALSMIKDAGYSYGFTSDSGFLDDSAGPFQLKRTNVGLRHPAAICALIEGWPDWLSALFARLKKGWEK